MFEGAIIFFLFIISDLLSAIRKEINSNTQAIYNQTERIKELRNVQRESNNKNF